VGDGVAVTMIVWLAGLHPAASVAAKIIMVRTGCSAGFFITLLLLWKDIHFAETSGIVNSTRNTPFSKDRFMGAFVAGSRKVLSAQSQVRCEFPYA
jgi:hypothetical protein